MKPISTFTIAMISNTSWSIYNFRAGLIKQLLAAHIRIVIIAPRDEYSVLLEEWGCKFEPIYLEQYGTNPIKDLHFCAQLHRIFKKHRLQFLITYTIKPNVYANLIARWHKIPGIAVVTGLGHLFTITSWKTYLVKFLYWIAFKTVHQVWFLNKEDMHFFVRKKITQAKQSYYLPSEGVDTQFFKRSITPLTQPFTFLFAGRLMDEKGIREYVQAARIIKSKYPTTQFQVLGFIEHNFPYAVTVQELNNWEKEGIINYLGTTDKIKDYLNQAHCVVSPTYYREGVPRILLEAASMEIPMIATDNVGCKDIVKHGQNGFLCKKRDAIDLAFWMEQMMQLPEKKRMQMGSNGRVIAHHCFREKLIINRYLNALQQFMAFNSVKSYEIYPELKKVIHWYYQM